MSQVSPYVRDAIKAVQSETLHALKEALQRAQEARRELEDEETTVTELQAEADALAAWLSENLEG